MSGEDTRAVLAELDKRLAAGDVDGVAALFAEHVKWDIPGATDVVPWIGERRDRAAVRDFYAEIGTKYLERDRFDVEHTFVDGTLAVRVGVLRSRARATGKWIESRFAQEFTVENGEITRYFLHEDSWAVANAVH